jgi:hypothetical protein
MRAKRLNVSDRRKIFEALVVMQDLGIHTVAESRSKIEEEYKITDAQLRQIEEEGIEKEWPPLDAASMKAVV